MKKSSSVSLTLLAAVAMVAGSSCRNSEPRDCVDQNRRIVDNSFCQDTPAGGVAGSRFYYWYGGSSGGHMGDTVFGGSASPSVSSGAVSRGGFGSSLAGGAAGGADS
jgi:hypothetical protein